MWRLGFSSYYVHFEKRCLSHQKKAICCNDLAKNEIIIIDQTEPYFYIFICSFNSLDISIRQGTKLQQDHEDDFRRYLRFGVLARSQCRKCCAHLQGWSYPSRYFGELSRYFYSSYKPWIFVLPNNLCVHVPIFHSQLYKNSTPKTEIISIFEVLTFLFFLLFFIFKVLATSSPSGVCYVSTMSLDGETNLKPKSILLDSSLFVHVDSVSQVYD